MVKSELLTPQFSKLGVYSFIYIHKNVIDQHLQTTELSLKLIHRGQWKVSSLVTHFYRYLALQFFVKTHGDLKDVTTCLVFTTGFIFTLILLSCFWPDVGLSMHLSWRGLFFLSHFHPDRRTGISPKRREISCWSRKWSEWPVHSEPSVASLKRNQQVSHCFTVFF